MKRKAYLWFARPNRVVLLVSGCLLAGLIAGSARAIDPTFAPAPGSPVTVGTNPRSVAAADLNGDGKPDLAVANFYSSNLTILLHTAGATALTLRTFAARRTGHGVELRWRTAQETALLGFNVYRSGVKVNRTLIAARGAVSGAGYRLVDRSGRVGAASTYRLQAVHADGTRVWIGRAVTRR